LQDLSHLAQLSESEASIERRLRFRRLRSLIIILLAASLICFTIFFIFGVTHTFNPY
jgi:hypothetical protein